MILININEAKANLSKYIQKACKGEKVFISKKNVSVVELKPVESNFNKKKHSIEFAKGKIKIWNKSFFSKVVGGWKGAKITLDKKRRKNIN